MRSENVLVATGLKKTFKLSRKQQRIERTDKTVKVAVDGLSFTARRGEIYGLLGPNGAGKTTTLRMLATLIKPDEGDAVIDGESIVKNPEKVRGKIGFLTSELKLEDFFTPEYLYGYFSELHGVEKSVAEKRKNALFKKFGIDKFAEVKVGDLSTGMKQKVSLVISIVHAPDFIIFDEPTNGLDQNQIVEIRHLIKEIAEEHTVILSTHILSEVQATCDYIRMIEKGQVVFAGTMEVFDNYIVPNTIFVSLTSAPPVDELKMIFDV